MASIWAEAAIPIAQALIVSLGFIGVAIAVYQRLGKLVHSVDKISDSISEVEDAVQEVDLKEMERTVTKLDWWLDDKVESGNSVQYTLEHSGIDVVISLSPEVDNQSQLALWSQSEEDILRDNMTTVTLSFSERLYTRAVVNALATDDELTKLETELFGSEPGFTTTSPMEMRFTIPSDDFEKIAEWMPKVVDKIDQYNNEFKSVTDDFDRVVADRLGQQGKVR